MSEREHYEPGVPCWVDTAQPDVDSAVSFYSELFGWEVVGPGEMPGPPPGRYFVARTRGRDVAGVSSLPEGAAPAWNTYIAVDSADAAAERVRDAGGAVIVAPFDAPPAGRMAVVADPTGAAFCLWEGHDRSGAQVVNEPSAWSMSMLSTNDLAGASAFYETVFGWKAERVDFGGAEITLFRLPGYVGGEPHQPVPRDVVGVMTPLKANGTGPHWSVDFWIRDADGAAATAAKLGGTVVAGPYDNAGFRSAMIRDPQGAMFSVSQLKAGT